MMARAFLLVLVSSWTSGVFGFPIRSKTSRLVVVPRISVSDAVEVASVAEDPSATSTADAVICGGGPAGLLSAIMLAKKFPNSKIKLFDRLAPPPSPTDEAVWSDVAKFYLIGLGSRGQTALNELGVWKDVEDVSVAVLGRMDWSPESPEEGSVRIFSDRPVDTQVLPRDKLVGVLHKHILDNFSDRVEMNFGYEVVPVDFAAGDDGKQVTLRVFDCEETNDAKDTQSDVLCNTQDSMLLKTDLVIAADGTARTFANRMEREDREKRRAMNPIRRLLAGKPFTVKRYVDDNQRIYKTVPIQLPEDWRGDLNYSARSKGGRVTFDALPANARGSYCGALLLKGDDPFAKADCDPQELRQLFDEYLPQFSKLVDDETMATVAKKPPSYLPSFRYVGPRLNQGERTLILGDCAHTVKPYFGLGANSALEDVKILGEILDSTSDVSQAVKEFSDKRAGEAKTLVKLSRELDRPGKLGFLTFILPLILDSIFNRMAPKVFAPNTIAMLQLEGVTFRAVARRKRLDRIAQVGILSSFVGGAAFTTRVAIQAIAKTMGRKTSTVVAVFVGGIAMASLAKKIGGYLIPGMAPADVLTKTKSKVVESETLSSSDTKQ